MKNNEKIRLPKSKIYVVTNFICCIGMILFGLNSFHKFFSDTDAFFTLCICVAIFLVNTTQIYVSEDGIAIKFLFIPIKRIAANKIARIEIIDWGKFTRVVFEIGKCPRFREDNWVESLNEFYRLNPFRTIEYLPPTAQLDAVLELLESKFPGKVSIVEKDH